MAGIGINSAIIGWFGPYLAEWPSGRPNQGRSTCQPNESSCRVGGFLLVKLFSYLAVILLMVGVMGCRSEPEVDVDATVEARLAEASRAADLTAKDATIEALEARIQESPPETPAAEPDLAATIAALVESRLQQVSASGSQSANGQQGQDPTVMPQQTPQSPATVPTRLPSAQDAGGDSILHDPVWRGNNDAVKALLQAGADPNSHNSDGNPVIYEAVWRGHADIVQLLIDAGADPNSLDADDAPILIEATWRKHTDVVRILVAAGADPLLADPGGRTAVSEASWRGHTEILQILTSGGN